MKKVFSFLVLFFLFYVFVNASYEVEAGINPNFDIIGDTEPEDKSLIYTGIKATLHEKNSGREIKNRNSSTWDLYVKPNKDRLVKLSEVSNLFLVSEYDNTFDVYPIAGYAEFLNGIVHFNAPKFRVLVSESNFYTGKTTSFSIRKDYDVFQLPGIYTAFYYKNGSKDTNFELTKAFNSKDGDSIFLVFKRDTKVMYYYKFKGSEVGVNSKIISGNFLDWKTSSAIVKTNFNSIIELNKTLDSSYYYIPFVLFLY